MDFARRYATDRGVDSCPGLARRRLQRVPLAECLVDSSMTSIAWLRQPDSRGAAVDSVTEFQESIGEVNSLIGRTL